MLDQIKAGIKQETPSPPKLLWDLGPVTPLVTGAPLTPPRPMKKRRMGGSSPPAYQMPPLPPQPLFKRANLNKVHAQAVPLDDQFGGQPVMVATSLPPSSPSQDRWMTQVSYLVHLP